jgi:transposase-like protein
LLNFQRRVMARVVERLRVECIVTTMRRGDVICPQCKAGFRRIELASRPGVAGEYRCPLCHYVLEVFDGSTDIAYRLTVAPEKMFE